MGCFFHSDFETLDEVDEQDPETLGGADTVEDPAVSMAYDTLPSSMGISFFISDTTGFECEVEGAVYQAGWKRKRPGRRTRPNLKTPKIRPMRRCRDRVGSG